MIKRMVFLMAFCHSYVCGAETGHIFNVTLSGATLTIAPVYNPKAPNQYYQEAGLSVLTPNFTVTQCTLNHNNYCQFGTSTQNPASLALSGPSGPISVRVCLNSNNKTANCETHKLLNSSIIFITSEQFTGNLGEVAGADAICNQQAYQAGSIISPGRTFKALLLSPTRYPCSNPNNNKSGRCSGTYAHDWPLVSEAVYYQPNGIDVFGTVNANGVFNGDNVVLQETAGNRSNAQFWSGIQSIHSTPGGFYIDGWAYDDMSPTTDHESYIAHLGACQNWTEATQNGRGSVGAAGRQSGNMLGPVPENAWGNYYYFQDGYRNYLFNLFNYSAYFPCNGRASLVCVG